MRPLPLLLTTLACLLTLVTLDLVFLGWIAADFYARTLGPLRAETVVVPAAVAFYALYLTALLVHAVLPSPTPGAALRRGAGLGLVAYGTWDLTNWSVIAGFPAALVPVDMAWGVFLSATVAGVGRVVWGRLGGAPPA